MSFSSLRYSSLEAPHRCFWWCEVIELSGAPSRCGNSAGARAGRGGVAAGMAGSQAEVESVHGLRHPRLSVVPTDAAGQCARIRSMSRACGRTAMSATATRRGIGGGWQARQLQPSGEPFSVHHVSPPQIEGGPPLR
jgi:hypothetical protein